jgi:hypothetical protein
MAPERRRLYLGILGAAVLAAALGGVIAWKLSRPRRLGLEQARVVLAAGQATADGARVRAAQALPVGATLGTERGSVCISIHGSRVCMGANSTATLEALGDASATLKASRGTLIVESTRDVLSIVTPGATVRVAAATAAIEEIGSPRSTLRVLDGNVTLRSGGRPDLVFTSPDAVDPADGSKRHPAPDLEREERSVTQLATEWQGTAGAVVDIEDAHGRVELDGAYVGIPPATVLVSEGDHALVVRDTAREITHETLRLAAGQTLVRGK